MTPRCIMIRPLHLSGILMAIHPSSGFRPPHPRAIYFLWKAPGLCGKARRATGWGHFCANTAQKCPQLLGAPPRAPHSPRESQEPLWSRLRRGASGSGMGEDLEARRPALRARRAAPAARTDAATLGLG